MRFTTWAEYGMIVSVHLAHRHGTGPTSAREMAAREKLPADYVEQILMRLRRAGLVSSVRGAKGGYSLAREPARISAKDVIEAAENHTFEVNCDSHPVHPQRCGTSLSCSIRPLWRAVQYRVDDLLDSVSLADLMAPEDQVESLVGLVAGGGASAADAARDTEAAGA